MTEAEIEMIVESRVAARLAAMGRLKKANPKARKFSDAEMMAAQKEGLTMREAADRFGVHISAVGHRARAIGLQFTQGRVGRRRDGSKVRARAAAFAAMVNAGMSKADAARELGLSKQYPYNPQAKAALAALQSAA